MVAGLLPIATGVVAVVYLAYWVFRDAPIHGLDPRKWALIAVVLPPVGLFVYLRHRAAASDELENGDLFGFMCHQ